MARINLLPWRDELREKRKKEFIAVCIAAALIGVMAVALAWFYYAHKLEDQEQANQLITSTNQNLDVQLKSLEGLENQRNAIIERMKLIQGLQGQRPIAVRLIDEMARVTPSSLYITKFIRVHSRRIESSIIFQLIWIFQSVPSLIRFFFSAESEQLN